MFNEKIKSLIADFSRFPGIGRRNATRFIFYLIKLPKVELKRFIADLAELLLIHQCEECFFPVFNTEKPKTHVLCVYCSDKARDTNSICVVEKESDLLAIEATGKFNGLYHILGGTVLTLSDMESGVLRVKELSVRIKKKKTEAKPIEIILALRPTTEGDATSLYLERVLNPLGVTITRIARGISTGADLEYADEATLIEALTRRH